jgi:hypothetical protein
MVRISINAPGPVLFAGDSDHESRDLRIFNSSRRNTINHLRARERSTTNKLTDDDDSHSFVPISFSNDLAT